jgi:hypothetical protein
MGLTVKIMLSGILFTTAFLLTGCGGGTNYYGAYYQTYPEYGSRRVVSVREYRSGPRRADSIGYPKLRPKRPRQRPSPTPRRHR